MAYNQDMLNAYQQNQKAQPVPSSSSREVDSRALLDRAWRMDDAKKQLADNPKSKDCLKAYGDAIRMNQQLWTIFQVALSDAQNPLPVDLKVILFNLARFVDKTSFHAVGKFAPELVDCLVNINRTIAKGLNTQPTVEAMAAEYPVEMRDMPVALTTSA